MLAAILLSMNLKKIITFFSFLCLALALYELGLRLWFELRGPITWDTPIYFTVGKGMLQGLLPYRDLFETKPPGIFFLAGFSYLFTRSFLLTHVAQVLVIAGIAFLPLFPLITQRIIYPIFERIAGHIGVRLRSGQRSLFGKTHTQEDRLWLGARWGRDEWTEVRRLIPFLLITISLALFAAERSGEVQVESFGAFFASCFILLLLHKPKVLDFRILTLQSLVILCALGFKEPFLLSILAGVLLIARKPTDVLQKSFVPILIAGVVGLLIASALGILEPYRTIYLPEMLGKHIQAAGPLWKRGFLVERLFLDMRNLSPWLPLLVGCTFVLYFRREWDRCGPLWTLGKTAIALYLLALSVGVGGAYFNHHYVFALPGYMAVVLLLCTKQRISVMVSSSNHDVQVLGDKKEDKESKEDKEDKEYEVFSVVTLLLTTFFLIQLNIDYEGRLAHIRSDKRIAKESAKQIDAILDACEVDRYLFIGSNGIQPYAYTKHLPLGPVFFQFHHWFTPERVWFQESFLSALDQAEVIAQHQYHLGVMTDQVRERVSREFTADVPDCAKGIAFPDQRYQVLFRL